MRIKRSLKKSINVITAVGCIIYAAFQGGMGKKIKSLRPSDFKFSFSLTTTPNQMEEDLQDGWMNG